MTDRGNQLPNLEVNGGEISGNKAGTYGGGICVSAILKNIVGVVVLIFLSFTHF